MCGIYKITNTINGKSYIGQSIDISLRWEKHKYEAYNSNQKSYNFPLNRAIRKYNIENFTLDIIEECPKELLDEREKYWINYYGTFYEGYNATQGGDTGPSLPGSKNPNARLTEEDVYNIRTAILAGRFQKEVYEEDHYADKISFRQFCRIWRGDSWKHVVPEAIEYVKTKEYLSKVRSHARSCQESMKRAQIAYNDIKKRKEKGEARLDVYYLHYENQYSLSGFNKIWYRE